MRLGDRRGEIGESQMPQRAAYDDGGESEQYEAGDRADQPADAPRRAGRLLDDGRRA
jgi:hypothetical protein